MNGDLAKLQPYPFEKEHRDVDVGAHSQRLRVEEPAGEHVGRQAADTVEITVTGKGGHAAKPHDCIDTTVLAAHIIVALQTIASRGVDPLKQVVVSICAVETDATASAGTSAPRKVSLLSDAALRLRTLFLRFRYLSSFRSHQ